MKKLIMLVLAVTLLFSGPFTTVVHASSSVEKATVNLSSLLIREYPSPKAKSVGSLKKGDVTYIHAIKPGGWAEIRHNKKPAYVPVMYLQRVVSESSPTKTTTTTYTICDNVYVSDEMHAYSASVNMSTLIARESPSPKAKAVCILTPEETTYVYDLKPGGWSEIRHDGKPVYVPSQYIQKIPGSWEVYGYQITEGMNAIEVMELFGKPQNYSHYSEEEIIYYTYLAPGGLSWAYYSGRGIHYDYVIYFYDGKVFLVEDLTILNEGYY